jgi:hypothetical protein
MSNRNPFAARAYLYFTIFMIVVYVGVGLMLIFVLKMFRLQPSNRIAAGTVLILYGCYRTYKLIRDRKNFSSTNRENESA